MYPGLFTSLYERDEDECDSDKDGSPSNSDREEIEQALYAQIHYCQIEQQDNEHIDLDNIANTKQNTSSEYIVEIENKELETKAFPDFDTSQEDSCIVLSSGIEDSPLKDMTISKPLKKGQNKLFQNDVIAIDTQSDSDVISLSSQGCDGETGSTSDSSFYLSSDCMALDESCDDMGDIVVNVDKNQRQMLNHLTVRDIKEQDEAGKWTIIDQDRFQGNPLLGRYYKSSSVRCHNCNEVGHLSKVCPKPRKTIVCYLCGAEGHHGKACSNPVCFNCYAPGHMFADCKEPRRSKHLECYRCEMFGHASYCPEIWRQFHLTTVFGRIIRGSQKENKKRHCPNCAGDDHFDYECEEERMNRNGVPSCPLIKQYRKADLKSQKRHRERAEDDSDIPRKKSKTKSVKPDSSCKNQQYDEDFIRSKPGSSKTNENEDFIRLESSKRNDKKDYIKLKSSKKNEERDYIEVKSDKSRVKKKSSKKTFKEKKKELENADKDKSKKHKNKNKNVSSSRKGKYSDSNYGYDSKKKQTKSVTGSIKKKKSENNKQKNKDSRKKDKKKSSLRKFGEQILSDKKKKKKQKKAKDKTNFGKDRGFKVKNGLFQISFKNT